MRRSLAPAIAGLPQWYVEAQLQKFRAGYRGAHFDDIAGMRMRPMSLSLENDADVTAVAAYVASLRRSRRRRARGRRRREGQALYAPCAACHGARRRGQPGGARRRRSSTRSDWYLLPSSQNFKAGVRGTKPGDTSGALMRPMSMTLADEQAMQGRDRLHHDPGEVARRDCGGPDPDGQESYSADELAQRAFLLIVGAVGLFIAVVFIFIIL